MEKHGKIKNFFERIQFLLKKIYYFISMFWRMKYFLKFYFHSLIILILWNYNIRGEIYNLKSE